MPVNRITASRRGKAAVAAAVLAAAVGGWTAYKATQTTMTPAAVHAAIDKGLTPPAVTLAVDTIRKWEGLRTTAYLDTIARPPVWTYCFGETEGARPGLTKTAAECAALLQRRVVRDYYLPLVDGVRGFSAAPDSVQAALTSGAYNFGLGAAKNSTAARLVTAGRYRQACEAQTAFNKAGGQVRLGLVNRREMGDAQRIGEAELCVSGL